ncbi:MAG TPA: branched-chain amino acid ABC transporter permease [Acidimicrobiales bacterium]|nr:branched-chain amino acid ABC transporter permease [Acidimicrobiales bacterium]
MAAILDRVRSEPRAMVGPGIGIAVVALLLLSGSTGRTSLIIGLITGAAYSLIAMGIVLIYKSSGVFNFAQGEFGTVAIFVLFLLRQNDVPYALAALLALVAAGLMGLVVEVGVVRPLFEAPRVTLLVATAGVALLAIGTQVWLGDNTLRNVEPALTRGDRIRPLGIFLSDQRLLILAVVVVVGVLLAAFFRTNLGLAVLAASQEATATNLVGISVRRLSSLVWLQAALLGGVAGILLGPTESFTPGFVTSRYLILGFTAAVIGGMSSLPGAVLGGVIVGVGEALGAAGTLGDAVPGGGFVITFALLAAILALRPQGLLGKA